MTSPAQIPEARTVGHKRAAYGGPEGRSRINEVVDA